MGLSELLVIVVGMSAVGGIFVLGFDVGPSGWGVGAYLDAHRPEIINSLPGVTPQDLNPEPVCDIGGRGVVDITEIENERHHAANRNRLRHEDDRH